jgi:hypothetical protein
LGSFSQTPEEAERFMRANCHGALIESISWGATLISFELCYHSRDYHPGGTLLVRIASRLHAPTRRVNNQ